MHKFCEMWRFPPATRNGSRRKQEPLALPLPAEPLAHRSWGAGGASGRGSQQSKIMCTLAHRRGLGNVAWLSSNCATLGNPKTAKPTLIWSASTLVALTVNGARALHDLMVPAKPHHVDLWLRAQLEEHTEILGCCYVNPPIGSTRHTSQVVSRQ